MFNYSSTKTDLDSPSLRLTIKRNLTFYFPLEENQPRLIYAHHRIYIVSPGRGGGGGGGLLPYKKLMGMCRWMGSHFHDWIGCNGVAFSIKLLEWAARVWILGVRKFFIFMVSKGTRMFVL